MVSPSLTARNEPSVPLRPVLHCPPLPKYCALVKTLSANTLWAGPLIIFLRGVLNKSVACKFSVYPGLTV